MDIDLVYLWVNGNDPKWQAKRDACIGRPTERQENCKGRYADITYSASATAIPSLRTCDNPPFS